MKLVLDSPLDMHLHLRDAEMLRLVAPLTAKDFSAAVIMPNLVPPVTSTESMLNYQERILLACEGLEFKPYMSLFFKPYTEAELVQARQNGLFGIKLYPAGATTNSDGGVSHWGSAEPTLKLMEELGIPLLVHGESHGFVMDREEEFLAVYRDLATRFPRLTISMEHITTAAALKLLDEFENLVATVTLQHLIITLDDLAGGMLKPHLFCKPIAKRPEDRNALLQAALQAHPKLMFGSDSAPHPIHAKESCGCAAGVFTAPLALPRLAQLFAENQALDHLQDFISGTAQRIYGITPPKKKITLCDSPMIIPASYQGYGKSVIPMDAGTKLTWSVLERS